MKLTDEATRELAAHVMWRAIMDVRRGAVLLRRLQKGKLKPGQVNLQLRRWDVEGALSFFSKDNALWQAILGADIVDTYAVMGMIGKDLLICREWFEGRRRDERDAALEDAEDRSSA